MPRRGPATRKAAPKRSAPKKAKVPEPAPPPPPPPPAPHQTSTQRDIFDEMMGSEVSSDNSGQEVTPVRANPVTPRKSPRYQDSVARPPEPDSDEFTIDPTPNVTTASSKNNGSRRRKGPAPQKTQVAALKEIARLRRTTEPVIPKLPFARLIREILLEYSHRELRITSESLQCLQESAEIFAVQLMEDAYRCTLHRDRLTLMPKDMKLAMMLRKDSVMI